MPTIEELAAEVASLSRRVDASESILEIQALKARYGELVDQRFSVGAVVDDPTLERIAGEDTVGRTLVLIAPVTTASMRARIEMVV